MAYVVTIAVTTPMIALRPPHSAAAGSFERQAFPIIWKQFFM